MTTKKTASKSKDVKEVKTVETAETQVNESRAVQASGAVADKSPVLEKKAQDHTTVVIPYCKEFAQGIFAGWRNDSRCSLEYFARYLVRNVCRRI